VDNLELTVNGHHLRLARTAQGRIALALDHVYAGTWCDAQTACYAAAMMLQRRREAN
jgi:hypothetical protein